MSAPMLAFAIVTVCPNANRPPERRWADHHLITRRKQLSPKIELWSDKIVDSCRPTRASNSENLGDPVQDDGGRRFYLSVKTGSGYAILGSGTQRLFPCQWKNSRRGRNQCKPGASTSTVGQPDSEPSVQVIVIILQNQSQEHARCPSDDYEQGATCGDRAYDKVVAGYDSQDLARLRCICPKKGNMQLLH
ncbi:hypothetical protein BU17DRAFT_70823 [Hysterangium stoloniferum]|nr:hypothetical protein BU17DRAFT_70823 [Hysterangium stoloniferum]